MVKKIDNPIRATSKLAQEKEVGTEGKESREGEREREREERGWVLTLQNVCGMQETQASYTGLWKTDGK